LLPEEREDVPELINNEVMVLSLHRELWQKHVCKYDSTKAVYKHVEIRHLGHVYFDL
jgi:hypothetical protein